MRLGDVAEGDLALLGGAELATDQQIENAAPLHRGEHLVDMALAGGLSKSPIRSSRDASQLFRISCHCPNHRN